MLGEDLAVNASKQHDKRNPPRVIGPGEKIWLSLECCAHASEIGASDPRFAVKRPNKNGHSGQGGVILQQCTAGGEFVNATGFSVSTWQRTLHLTCNRASLVSVGAWAVSEMCARNTAPSAERGLAAHGEALKNKR